MMNLSDLVYFHSLLGEFGLIEREQLLPNNEKETDSHHSFSLALICYELAKQYEPDLDTEKVLLYALTHDLSELITGDVNTLTATQAELDAKAVVDALALPKTQMLFHMAPYISEALQRYDAKLDDEALFVWWIDKCMPALAHLYNDGILLHEFNVNTVEKLSAHKKLTITKLTKYGLPPLYAITLINDVYDAMYEMLEKENANA